jgi:Ca2+-binding EF-hand superfamily protein
MAAFSSRDRFSDHLKQVDRQPRKGRSKLNRNFGGGAPFYQDTPSKADLQRGLSELGFKMSPQQFEKLRNMHGAEVLKSIVTIGRRSGDGPTSASDNSSSSSRNGGQKVKVELNHTGQTDKRNRESVDALLQMPAPEAKRIVASGDYSEDTDRVVTGLESDRHRHFEYKELGRKKAELHALQCLKACGPDPATVFKKIQKHNTSGGGGGGGGGDTKTNDALSKKEIRQGLAELAGVQLSSADLDSVIRKFDPKTGGKDGITLRQFSQVLSKIPNVHKAKTGRQARQHHIDVINLTNKKSLDPNKLAAAVNQRAIASIDSKVSKRFGTEPERLRRLFKAMESNGKFLLFV